VIEAPSITVEALTAGDWPAVSAIYADGIATRNATFETEVPSWEAWSAAHLPDHRLVARESGSEPQTLGWAALSAYSDRCAYAGVAEVSVYVAKEARGRGVGHKLLEALVESAEDAGIWTLQAGVFPENRASLSLHRSCGFRVVGVRERIGQLDGQWRDVVLLERRSKEVAG
jgi:L-amino acid N-acyltransferase YncA